MAKPIRKKKVKKTVVDGIAQRLLTIVDLAARLGIEVDYPELSDDPATLAWQVIWHGMLPPPLGYRNAWLAGFACLPLLIPLWMNFAFIEAPNGVRR